jgi:hypothetical protein
VESDPKPAGNYAAATVCLSRRLRIYINSQLDAVDETNPVFIENNRFSGNLIRAITTERDYTIIVNNRMSTDVPQLFDTFPRGIQLTAGNNHSVIKNKVDDIGSSVFQIGIQVNDGVDDSTISKNYSVGSEQYDLVDGNGDCDSNTWLKNKFNTSDPACIE